MDDIEFQRELLTGAIGGVSKTQLLRTLTEKYGCTEEYINEALDLCSLKTKPKHIRHKDFYDCPITKKAKKINYPFTQIYKQEDFLSEAECDDLIDLMNQNLRPSTVSDETDSNRVSSYRTSTTADLHYFDNDFYLHLDKKISEFMGLEPFLGEVMQAKKYRPGQYFKEHWDFFDPLTKEYKIYCEWMGQRTWTTMIYLNDVEEGGETWFKHLKLTVKPKRGLLLAWNNLYKNGVPNFKTMHEAFPPKQGDKYVITKWWRSWALI